MKNWRQTLHNLLKWQLNLRAEVGLEIIPSSNSMLSPLFLSVRFHFFCIKYHVILAETQTFARLIQCEGIQEIFIILRINFIVLLNLYWRHRISSSNLLVPILQMSKLGGGTHTLLS